ncbi:hypothetical protein B0I35DRAFT_220303 [Stachybotrys elegans]|uniref:Uncharacterized protein n=1 Tax=Stachybotrys elegans TaxID=80388 RepID=A0A8K0WR46_9HYPO|nr:hypothetical protein B0I35DRAFT_220303 [Stachybotrys elegans]
MRRRNGFPKPSHSLLLRKVQDHLGQPDRNTSIGSQPSLINPGTKRKRQGSHQVTPIPPANLCTPPTSEPSTQPHQTNSFISPPPSAPVDNFFNHLVDSESTLQDPSSLFDVLSTATLSGNDPSHLAFDSSSLPPQQDLALATTQTLPDMSNAARNGPGSGTDTPLRSTIDVRYSSDPTQGRARRVRFMEDSQTQCCVLQEQLAREMGLQVEPLPPNKGYFDAAQQSWKANYWVPHVILDVMLGGERNTFFGPAYVFPLPTGVEVLVNTDLFPGWGDSN